jgi:tight adherence protein C
MLILIIILVFMTIALLLGLIFYPVFLRTDAIGTRLRQIQSPKAAPKIIRRDIPATPLQKFVLFISQSIPLSGKSLSLFKLLLVQAGFRNPQTLARFLAAKVFLAAALVVLSIFYIAPPSSDLLSFSSQATLLGVLGFILPNIWLLQKKNQRQQEILYTLPDALDLLTVCIESGLGIDAAIVKVIDEEWFSKRAIAEEFRLVNQEVRVGKPRSEALRDMAERSAVTDLKSLAATLIQTERLGTSLVQALRVYSDSLRTKRRQRAEETAAKTTIKLVFPLVLFIFPALMVVLLGPAVVRIVNTPF